jgi:hypothetical protein
MAVAEGNLQTEPGLQASWRLPLLKLRDGYASAPAIASPHFSFDSVALFCYYVFIIRKLRTATVRWRGGYALGNRPRPKVQGWLASRRDGSEAPGAALNCSLPSWSVASVSARPFDTR